MCTRLLPNQCEKLVTATAPAFLIMFASVTAMAQSSPSESSGDTRFVIGDVTEIVVSEEQGRVSQAPPGSVDLLAGDQLRDEHVNLTMDLLKKIPGVTFSRFNQGIISADIGIRGFNAEGTLPSTKLLIDGIPANLHVGVPEMDALFPLELSAVEVVKGTNDPRYGLLNIAGNINMTSRRDAATELEVLTGSFDTQEIQGYHGHIGDALTQHYFVGHRQTDGYRDNAGLDKTTLAGKWFYQVNERLNLGLVTRHFEFEADAPGYLSASDAAATPRRSYDFSESDGGSKETRHVSLHADYDVSQTLSLSVKAYQQQFQRHRWVRFTEDADQQERYEDEQQQGFVAALAWQPTSQRVIRAGVDFQGQENRHQRFASEDRRRTGQILRDQDFDYDVLGTYVSWQEDVADRLHIVAGLRADRLSGNFVDRRSGQRREMMSYGTIIQPKLSATYDLNAQLDLFLNMGRSFQTGIGSGAYKTAGGQNLDVSLNDGWDAGVSYRPADSFRLRLSRWFQKASDEVVAKSDGSGDFENAGETERQGWELTFNYWPVESLSFWGSYTLQETELVNPGAASPALLGNEINHVPDYTASLGVELTHNAWTATLFSSIQGDFELNLANDRGRYGDYVLTDFTLVREMSWGDVSMRVNNLFDRSYEYVWYDSFFSGQNLFSPGNGRAFDLAVSWEL